jgi:WD40 repeat protein
VLVPELSFPGRPDGFPSVRADGREVFFSSGRPLNGVPVFDLWTSTRQSVHEAWSAPLNLGVPVNSSFAEFQPDLTHDGRTLLFIAGAGRGGEGGLDIWMSTRTPSGQ